MKRFFTLALCLLALPCPATQAQRMAAPAPDAPLPAIPALLHDVEIHQMRNVIVARNYIVHATQTVHNANGKNTVLEMEFYSINGVMIRHVLSRDGKPLPPEDADKEQKHLEKAVNKANKRKARAERKDQETDSDGGKLVPAARLLELSDISHVRRDTLRGRSVIVFDFTGRRNADSHGIFESILKSVNGTAWIDEQDHELAKIVAVVPENLRIGWGLLANISKGSTVTAENTCVRGEVWLPLRYSGQGSLHKFLFDKVIDGSLSVEYTDYRKFGTSVTIRPATDYSDAAPESAPPPQPAPQP